MPILSNPEPYMVSDPERRECEIMSCILVINLVKAVEQLDKI